MNHKRLILFVFSHVIFSLIVSQILAQIGDENVVKNDKEMITITISDGIIPTFSWKSEKMIGRLIVKKGAREYWGTETEGENIYKSPIKYGVHPPGAAEQESGFPLKAGETYTVSFFRWINVNPEKFQLVGEQNFTPSGGMTVGDNKSTEKEFEKLLDIDPSNFANPTKIDNEWWPLKPGTKYVYEGYTVEEGETIPHRIVFIVTDLTKVINGIRTVVIFDRDYSDAILEEAELTFFAQDNDGNVWHLGQYRETYDEVEFVGGRVWLVGHLEGAKAGIMMKVKPQLGSPSYSQGYAPPPFNWTDRARTYQMGQKTSVPVGNYDDVLVIEEYNEEEPGAFQLKYYARGVGNVRVGWRGDDQQQETMELVEYIQLSPKELEKVRAEALELEKRAYIYCTTPTVEH